MCASDRQCRAAGIDAEKQGRHGKMVEGGREPTWTAMGPGVLYILGQRAAGRGQRVFLSQFGGAFQQDRDTASAMECVRGRDSDAAQVWL